MAKTKLHCHTCSRSGTPDCCDNAPMRDACESFLSWADLWARETAAIERAQRITYAAAALLVMLATAAVVFPKALLS